MHETSLSAPIETNAFRMVLNGKVERGHQAPVILYGNTDLGWWDIK